MTIEISMNANDDNPRLSLESVLSQEPTKTSLVKLFCPLCGLRALTEKDGPGLYRVSCGRCRHAAIVQLASNVITPAPKVLLAEDAPELLRETIRQGSLDRTCARCGHVHQDRAECGKDMGGGGICRCDTELPLDVATFRGE